MKKLFVACLLLINLPSFALLMFETPANDGLISSADSNISMGISPTTNYKVTYTQAKALARGKDLVPYAWYNISTDSIYLQALSADSFALRGFYADSIIGEVDNIEYDFGNRHIQWRCDKRGNCVGANWVLIVNGRIADPIPLFAWGDDAINGNSVKDAVLDLTAFNGGLIYSNVITGLSKVTVTTEEDFTNNRIDNSTVAVSGNGIVLNATVIRTNLIASGAANCFACNLTDSDITLSDAANAADMVCYSSEVMASGSSQLNDTRFTDVAKITIQGNSTIRGSEVTASAVTLSGITDAAYIVGINSEISASGKCRLSNSEITGFSKVTLTDSVQMNGGKISESIVNGSGGADIGVCEVRKYSTLTVCDTVMAVNIILAEANTALLSGKVNAVGVKMATGAQLEASGQAFIEGLNIINVSKVTVRDSASMSPGLICNQTTLFVSGNVRAGNIYASSSYLTLQDSAYCHNCWFYSHIALFGTSLDTSNYTIYGRSQYTTKLHSRSLQLTDGSQCAGCLITGDANGNATWAKPYTTGAYKLAGDGVTMVFDIAHGLGTDPTSIYITPADGSVAEIRGAVLTKNETKITITCSSPPPAGTYTIYWQAYR